MVESNSLVEQSAALLIENHINNKLGLIHNDTGEIKRKLERHNYIVLVIVFTAGILIGTQYKLWLPYMADVVKTIRNTQTISKTITGG